MSIRDALAVYRALYQVHGAQGWWPAESPFETMVGAILTQNTSWTNVERALTALRAEAPLEPAALLALDPTVLAAALRPVGYFNVKARRLTAFCRWYLERGGYAGLKRLPTPALREALLAVHGIGPETADDILLYAFERPVFVIDAYTRRLFARLGLIEGTEPYEALRARFEQSLAAEPAPVALFNEYHALIVLHAKKVCRPRPKCTACVLQARCAAITP
ncbi:endonuclease [Ectothiorhodospiraceae bacterium 2226]|nr:endonuclease [Ectothiorhodospiraceae bacterium 2226]